MKPKPSQECWSQLLHTLTITLFNVMVKKITQEKLLIISLRRKVFRDLLTLLNGISLAQTETTHFKKL